MIASTYIFNHSADPIRLIIIVVPLLYIGLYWFNYASTRRSAMEPVM
jgi:hypothetical protein